jgi:hypothetical protein
LRRRVFKGWQPFPASSRSPRRRRATTSGSKTPKRWPAPCFRISASSGSPVCVAQAPRRLRREIVAAEIAVLPLAFGAWPVALIWSALNALLLSQRVRAEEAALAPRRGS